MWVVLAYSKITIIKSSYVSHGRPIHPKTNSSHGPWFWLLEVVVFFKFLAIFIPRLITDLSKNEEELR
ncbi:hypothetical protein [Wolbachia pipientis]|uniref:hypothetical protein n=1 Tax=Wolbachia pipientis TaxID=955 RepID=UPI00037A25D6|nr:hypothetical protein [Wolbachia pipientis]